MVHMTLRKGDHTSIAESTTQKLYELNSAVAEVGPGRRPLSIASGCLGANRAHHRPVTAAPDGRRTRCSGIKSETILQSGFATNE